MSVKGFDGSCGMAIEGCWVVVNRGAKRCVDRSLQVGDLVRVEELLRVSLLVVGPREFGAAVRIVGACWC